MVSRNRTMSDGAFRHRVIRRADLHVGVLYRYLIAGAADDEGRFVADAWSLLEEAFSRTHEITEQQVEDALQYLNDEGLILLYEPNGKRYGWLTGWFEHQYIQRSRESSIPAPPVPIASWQDAQMAREAYAEEHEIGNTQQVRYDEALAWVKRRGLEDKAVNDPSTIVNETPTNGSEAPTNGNGRHKPESEGDSEDGPNSPTEERETPSTTVNDSLTNGNDPLTNGIQDVKGRKGEVKNGCVSGASAREKPTDYEITSNSKDHVLSANHPELSAAVRRATSADDGTPHWPRPRQQELIRRIVRAFEQSDTITIERAIDYLDEDPPWPSRTAEGYMRRMRGSLEARDSPDFRQAPGTPSPQHQFTDGEVVE